MGRVDLPGGTVTFLFTDVEGSTRLLDELGESGYAAALSEHRRVVREACARHEGVEVDTQGDAFFVAFPHRPGRARRSDRADATVLAAGQIQLRVGMHTGTPLLTDEGYVGVDVHRAARIVTAGHGGQVVLSPSTVALLEPESFELRDLGEHRFKDIEEPFRSSSSATVRFPPLKTISNTNLPRPASSFVGRDAELAEVLSRIEAERVLSRLTGPGGRARRGSRLRPPPLSSPTTRPASSGSGLPPCATRPWSRETISQTLGAKDGLAEHIGERELLLLLDNLEQVIEVAPELSALVEACPNLTLLVTSRELLRIRGEVEYPVPPLQEPEAVALFCERAQPEPSDEITELCARLDNLPLAVELAAARVKALSPAQILERLSSRLDLLKGGRDVDPRQQTLRATIEWSYDLLSTKSSGSSPASPSSPAAARSRQPRTWQTPTSTPCSRSSRRASFASRTSATGCWRRSASSGLERLGMTSEEEELRARHAARHARLAVELRRPLREYSAEALATVEQEQNNMRAALEFALTRDEVVVASNLMAGLWFYWLTAGRGAEAGAWALRYLGSSRERVHPLERFLGDARRIRDPALRRRP